MRRTRLCQPINADVLILGVDIAKTEQVAVATHTDGRGVPGRRVDGGVVARELGVLAQDQIEELTSWLPEIRLPP
jgi:hypothetical protein